MGKLSKYKTKEHDFYPTPEKAVKKLLPFLVKGSNFYEPCAGDGTLIRHLKKYGHECVGAYDINPHECIDEIRDITRKSPAPSNDGHRNHTGYVYRDAQIITNPPWSRHLLHPFLDNIIYHSYFDYKSLSYVQAHAWLLIDLNWAATKQARPYLQHCSDIVVVGRLKWIADSKSAGLKDCAWYKFSRYFNTPKFHNK